LGSIIGANPVFSHFAWPKKRKGLGFSPGLLLELIQLR
jgi:hypothetical protein